MYNYVYKIKKKRTYNRKLGMQNQLGMRMQIQNWECKQRIESVNREWECKYRIENLKKELRMQTENWEYRWEFRTQIENGDRK